MQSFFHPAWLAHNQWSEICGGEIIDIEDLSG